MALNASPEGSTQIFFKTSARPLSSIAIPYTNGFEIDWIVKACPVSPTS
jgi:hypothetical protein